MSRQQIKHCRVVMGSVLMAAPFVLLAAFLPLGVILGSLGMDVHWNASRSFLYAAVLITVLSFVAVVLGGTWLYRTGLNSGNDA